MEILESNVPESVQAVEPEPRFRYGEALAGIIGRLFGLRPETAEAYRVEFGSILDLLGFDDAIAESGLGAAISPKARLALGVGVLFLGVLLYKKREREYYGDRDYRYRREREIVPTGENAEYGPKPTASSSGYSVGSQLEQMFTSVARADAGAAADTTTSTGTGGSGSDAVDAGGSSTSTGDVDDGGGTARRGNSGD